MVGRRLAVAISLLGLLICAGVMAAVPGKISYQGRLIEDGVPVDTNVDFRFAIYAGATAPTNVWAEAQYGVPVVQGIYNVLLGDSVAIPASVFAGSTTYLEVTVNGEVLSPRQPLSSVPYAMKAQSVPDGAISDVMLAPGAVTSDKILDHTIVGSDIAIDALGADQIQDIYVLNTGDTVTGDLDVRGNMQVGANETVAGDLAVIGGHIGIGIAPQPSYGVYIDKLTAPFYGAAITGTGVGLKAFLSGSEAANYVLLSTGQYGALAHLDNVGTGMDATGGLFEALSENGASGVYGAAVDMVSGGAVGVTGYASSAYANAVGGFFMSANAGLGIHTGVNSYAGGEQNFPAYGIYSSGYGWGSGSAYGGYFYADQRGTGIPYAVFAQSIGSSSNTVYGVAANAYNYADGMSYGGFFLAVPVGSGQKYGIWASGQTYAAWLQDGRVHIGNDGTENYVSGSGDLYVQNVLEVDGLAHFSGGIDAPGAIDSTDVSFNYAGSSSKGGIATDSDLLDGQHGAFYRDAGNINGGILGTSYYSAFADLSVEGFLDNNAPTDILIRSQSDGRYAALGHVHSGADITSGAVNQTYIDPAITRDTEVMPIVQANDGAGSGLDADLLDGQHGAFYRDAGNINGGIVDPLYFHAYQDLNDEGYLDNNNMYDLLTQTQSDGRFVNTTGDDAMSGSLTIGANLRVIGQIGIGGATYPSAGISNLYAASLPSDGANLIGTINGVMGSMVQSPEVSFGSLGHWDTYTTNYSGVYAESGPDYSINNHWGGNFHASGAGKTYGVGAYSQSSDILPAYGVYGWGKNISLGNAYGGYFFTDSSGTGKHYGISASSNYIPGLFSLYGDSINHRVEVATISDGMSVTSGNIADTAERRGAYFRAYSGAGAFGIRSYAYGNSNTYSVGVRGSAENLGTGPSYGGYFTTSDTGLGEHYAIHAYGDQPAGNTNACYGGNFDVTWNGNGVHYGIKSRAMNNSANAAYAGYFTSEATGAAPHYGLYATALSASSNNAYGLYGNASGSGTNIGVYGSAPVAVGNNYSARFEGNKVHIGSGGTENYVEGNGDLFVQDELEVGNDIYYSTAKTRYYGVSRPGEKISGLGQSFTAYLYYSDCPDGVTCGTYFPVDLPERATVVGFYVWGQTTSGSHSFSCWLSRFDNFGNPNDLAYVGSTNTSMTLSTTTISYAAVDNASYSYLVDCEENTASRGALNDVKIWRIRINYTVDGPE